MQGYPWNGSPTLRETLTKVAGGTPAASVYADARACIEECEPQLSAWAALDSRATSRAEELDARPVSNVLPLRGVPVGVKDIIDVAGLPTRCGSSVTSPDPAELSAACVERLEDCGAVVVGKTVTTEFAYFKPGPTKNPWNTGHTPGGSSSGSAAAVASGMVPLALGTQTAASLIRPAAYCGIAGLVMGRGTADLTGITGLSPSLDSLGFMARTVEDLRIAHAAFTGTDPVDAGAAPLLVWNGSDLADLDPAMRAALRRLPEWLDGWDVTDFAHDDHITTLAADHAVIMAYEAARERRRERENHLADLSGPLAELLTGGTQINEDDYWGADYRCGRSRGDLTEVLQGRFIIGPAAQGPAPAGLEATGSPIMSRPWQALGFPTVAVPGLVTDSGLPLGLQMIGAPGTEDALLAAAMRVEERLRGQPPVASAMQ